MKNIIKNNFKSYLIIAGYGYSELGVKRFQKEHGLPTTGRIDIITGYILEKKIIG